MNARLKLGVFAALAACGFFYADGMAANPTAKSHAAAKSVTTVATAIVVSGSPSIHPHHSVLANVLHELRQAKHMLHTKVHVAHHHRAKAIAEISHAIHLLEHHHGAHHKTTSPAAHAPVHSAAPAAPLTPASLNTADSKLRHAQKLVHAANHQLHHIHQGDHNHHLAKASHHLKEAGHHIQRAMHTVHGIERELTVLNK